jgi:phenylacetate-coenzyme A ligase PaaK-like adenylate-forming protein
MRITPLDPWIATRIGEAGSVVGREALEAHQLRLLSATLALASDGARAYRGRLPHRLDRLDDLADLPFTTADDLRADPMGHVCGSLGQVERIVTLDTSGTTGRPKRIAFTAEDQELTIDFFAVGMSTFTRPGDRVAILLPGETPGSVGDLLATALARVGATPLLHGPVSDPEASLRRIVDDGADVVVGVPTQVLAMARHPATPELRPALSAVLLSTDHLPAAIARAIEIAWGCTVYDHYGMTEMGLGGGVECQAHQGYHLREADMVFEIVDPASGAVVADGEPGEVVFTTLTRSAMPLIRYRTGDLSRLATGACPCGSAVRRLQPVRNRLDGAIGIGGIGGVGGHALTMADLDDALFPVEGVIGFDATVTAESGRDRLILSIRTAGAWDPEPIGSALLAAVPSLVGVDVRIEPAVDGPATVGKRRITDLRPVPAGGRQPRDHGLYHARWPVP